MEAMTEQTHKDLSFDDEAIPPMKELSQLNQDELLIKCQDLMQENESLRKKLSVFQKVAVKNKKYNQREFDFSRFKKRHVAFKIAYLGWDYQGLAAQDTTANTIEEHIFSALHKAKLIENVSSARYSRCGRTDKGVSAFGQVIAVDVRSNLKSGVGIIADDDENISTVANPIGEQEKSEIPYVKILNKNLPSDIRVIAYAPIDPDFDARFKCQSRTYKYFFPAADLDIHKMQIAAQKLVGTKDFRNFCKVDVGNNINHFIRRVISFQVNRVIDGEQPTDMCEMTITGLAFLWHQVRCMAAILILVGLGLESPEVIDFLLDVEQCPKRPQYNMASEIPLVLFDCEYEGMEWQYDHEYHLHNINNLTQMWTQKTVQSTMLAKMLTALKSKGDLSEVTSRSTLASVSAVLPGYRKGEYKTVAKRPVCEGLDRHLEKQAVKRAKLEERYAAINSEGQKNI